MKVKNSCVIWADSREDLIRKIKLSYYDDKYQILLKKRTVGAGDYITYYEVFEAHITWDEEI